MKVRRYVAYALVLGLACAVPVSLRAMDFLRLVTVGTPGEVRAAIDAGADLTQVDEHARTPLVVAAANNPDPGVIGVLLKSGADIVKEGYAALRPAAAYNPNPDVVRTLLRAGAAVDSGKATDFTPLMGAARSNPNPVVIAALLDAGADARVKNSYGKSALDYARDNPRLAGSDAYRRLQEAGR